MCVCVCVCIDCGVLLFLQMLHESLHDVVVERLKKSYSHVPIGDPLDGKPLDIDHMTGH